MPPAPEFPRALLAALEADAFEPFFQPVVRLSDGALVGFEALARWRRPDGVVLAPESFLAEATRAGLMGQISARMLARGAAALAGWRAAGFGAGLRLSVNVSGGDFEVGDLAAEALAAVAAAGLPAGAVQLELTEHELLAEPERAAEALAAVRAGGMAVALDDFGTGFSALSWLVRLPVDAIKLDRSFVRGLETDPTAAKIVRAILGLADDLGLATIAEGVGNEAQRAFLLAHGCGFGQGRLYGMALDAAGAAAHAASASSHRT